MAFFPQTVATNVIYFNILKLRADFPLKLKYVAQQKANISRFMVWIQFYSIEFYLYSRFPDINFK